MVMTTDGVVLNLRVPWEVEGQLKELVIRDDLTYDAVATKLLKAGLEAEKPSQDPPGRIRGRRKLHRSTMPSRPGSVGRAKVFKKDTVGSLRNDSDSPS